MGEVVWLGRRGLPASEFRRCRGSISVCEACDSRCILMVIPSLVRPTAARSPRRMRRRHFGPRRALWTRRRWWNSQTRPNEHLYSCFFVRENCVSK